ncbi:lysozyme family protein [Paraburkholderia bannensis]|uniref:hypothetical protein n=1 Tax=Paraburkholderia bannensis TaxID=765414 RepID=UPI002AB7DC40|nr:hypothetical protein [Paraburkholderia bannensis]
MCLALVPAAVCLALPGVLPSDSRADCIDDAAAYCHINVSFACANTVNGNASGSDDLGLLHLNASWLPKEALAAAASTSSMLV